MWIVCRQSFFLHQQSFCLNTKKPNLPKIKGTVPPKLYWRVTPGVWKEASASWCDSWQWLMATIAPSWRDIITSHDRNSRWHKRLKIAKDLDSAHFLLLAGENRTTCLGNRNIPNGFMFLEIIVRSTYQSRDCRHIWPELGWHLFSYCWTSQISQDPLGKRRQVRRATSPHWRLIGSARSGNGTPKAGSTGICKPPAFDRLRGQARVPEKQISTAS